MEKNNDFSGTSLSTNNKKVTSEKGYLYIKFCNTLFSVPANKRCEYLLSLNLRLCKISEYFTRYKKAHGKYCSEIDDFYNKYVHFYNEVNEFNKRQKNENKVKEACAYYDSLIDFGYYSINNYIFCARLSGEQINKERAKASKYRSIILSVDKGNLWNTYLEKMELNRLKQFSYFKDTIDSFYKNLCNKSVDIIDFYLQFDMPIDRFKELIKGYVSNSEISNFNLFFYPYGQILSTVCSEEMILNNNEIFGDFVFNRDQKQILIGFMRENHIPFQLYRLVFEKYINGSLSNCINSKVMKKEF